MDWRLHNLVAVRRTPAGKKRKNLVWRPALEVLEHRALLAASGALPADVGLNAPIGPQQGITAPAGAIVLSAASGTLANQTAIDNAASGTTIYFQAGTYADLSIQPKNNQTFLGQFGATLTSQQKVHAFFGSGTGITINNLIIDGYKTASQQYAIQGSDYWHVDHVEVRNSTAEGVLIGSHSSLTNSYVHDNGQMGIAADSSNNHCVDVLIANCQISHNNPQDAFDVAWEAGGSKFWNVNGLTITHCEFSDNVGNGLWMDGDLDGGGNTNVTITNTWCHGNLGIGIFQEIGGSALITNNLVENNGSPAFEGVGIELDDSESVTITNNVVRNNSNAILLESYARSDTVHKIQNDVVTNNTVMANQGNTGVLYFGPIHGFATGITFDYNQYTFTGSALFAWNGSWSYDWPQWQAVGNDSHSTFSASAVNTSTIPTGGRQLFYNQSAFDGASALINASDDGAIATDKTAYLPDNSLAVFNNVSSYNKGINGVMVDLLGGGSHTSITAADFTFKAGVGNTPSGWGAGPGPATVSVRTGAGVSGSDRVEIIWGANAVKNQWLEVQVLANANTGLAATDVFFWGSKLGDTGSPSATDFSTVVAGDGGLIIAGLGAGTGLTNVRDMDRTNSVTVAGDRGITIANLGTLNRLQVPSAGPFAPVGGGLSASPATSVASDSGVASALAVKSSGGFEWSSTTLPPWLESRLQKLQLHLGSIPSYFQHLFREPTAKPRSSLPKLDQVVDALGLDETLVTSLSKSLRK